MHRLIDLSVGKGSLKLFFLLCPQSDTGLRGAHGRSPFLEGMTLSVLSSPLHRSLLMCASLSGALPSEHFPELDALSAPFLLQSCRQCTACTVGKRLGWDEMGMMREREELRPGVGARRQAPGGRVFAHRTRPGSARNGDVGPPSSRLTTRRKVHEGPVQCGLGSSRGGGPRRPNPWTKTLAIGT
ncbi:hypothetical protein L3Q82_000333 [Scortum barcoo]|uniref:Uncharacterized protein n=1 Tax=Scortum barcoo TaxID=214431 RepID=A0ACB8XAH6_9TELE|nr:hypothetical protein L3Q82_000333 [Scortum barcoo]